LSGARLFLRQDNAPLGAAVSIVMMAIIFGLVAVFLWLVGYCRIPRSTSLPILTIRPSLIASIRARGISGSIVRMSALTTRLSAGGVLMLGASGTVWE
jgi:hypothetical protein